MTRKGKNIGFINVVINTILLVLSLAIIIYPLFQNVEKVMLHITAISIIIIILQIIGIVLSYKYEEIVERSIFNMSKKKVFEHIKPYAQKSSIQDAREELRFGLHILLFIVIVIYICFCIRFQSALSFLSGTSLILLAYMYADYIPHAIQYAELYDKNYINQKDKRSAVRGLARIYLKEYQKTNFDRKNEFYKKIMEYKFENNAIQDSCIKHILFMKADSIRCPEIVYSLFLMTINIVLIAPNLLDHIINEVIGEVDVDMRMIKVMAGVVVNVVFAIINIVVSVTYRQKCEEIKGLYDAINDRKVNCKRRRFEKYEECRKDKSHKEFEVIRSRGIFVFCSTFISNAKTLDNIPLKYKMLYIHRYYANIPRFRITVALIVFCMIILLFECNAPVYVIIFALLLDLFIAFLFGKFVLPNLGKRRIANECKELLKGLESVNKASSK